MPKKHFTLVLFLFLCITLNGQEKDSARLIVHYIFKFMPDTTMKDVFLIENTVLFIGTHSSLYTGYDTYRYDSTVQARIVQRKQGQIQSSIYAGLSLKNPLASKYFKFFPINKLITVERFYKDFQKEEMISSINWRISNSTKKIENLLCQKATCEFKGRVYEAWFCPELPYVNGPWKLGQLPGLILEAHDSKNEVFFEFSGFSIPADNQKMIQLPENAITTAPTNYKNLKQAFLEDPVSFFENTPGLVSGTISGGRLIGGSANATRPKRKLNNNRIELVE